MSNELSKALIAAGYKTETGLHRFASKLQSICSVLNNENTVEIIKLLPEEIRGSINKQEKADMANNVSINVWQKQIEEFEKEEKSMAEQYENESDNADENPDASDDFSAGLSIDVPEEDNTENIPDDSKTKTDENIENKEMYADISGAVKNPGMYSIKENERIGHLVEKAGGLSEDADVDSINMSMNVGDGDKIIIKFRVKENVYIKEKNDAGDDDEKNIPEYKLTMPTEEKNYYIETVKRKSLENNHRIKDFFLKFKTHMFNKSAHCPVGIQNMLEKVEDPVKLNILTKAYFDGLSMSIFRRLLIIQDKIKVENMKELIDFYIKLDKEEN